MTSRFEDWTETSTTFDAAFLISTIEHVGLGAYGEPGMGAGADREAVEKIRGLLAPDGYLGPHHALRTRSDHTARADLRRGALAVLLDGWTITDRSDRLPPRPTTWTPVADAPQPPRTVRASRWSSRSQTAPNDASRTSGLPRRPGRPESRTPRPRDRPLRDRAHRARCIARPRTALHSVLANPSLPLTGNLDWLLGEGLARLVDAGTAARRCARRAAPRSTT